jgi:hypothetical protein
LASFQTEYDETAHCIKPGFKGGAYWQLSRVKKHSRYLHVLLMIDKDTLNEHLDAYDAKVGIGNRVSETETALPTLLK